MIEKEGARGVCSISLPPLFSCVSEVIFPGLPPV